MNALRENWQLYGDGVRHAPSGRGVKQESMGYVVFEPPPGQGVELFHPAFRCQDVLFGNLCEAMAWVEKKWKDATHIAELLGQLSSLIADNHDLTKRNALLKELLHLASFDLRTALGEWDFTARTGRSDQDMLDRIMERREQRLKEMEEL